MVSRFQSQLEVFMPETTKAKFCLINGEWYWRGINVLLTDITSWIREARRGQKKSHVNSIKEPSWRHRSWLGVLARLLLALA